MILKKMKEIDFEGVGLILTDSREQFKELNRLQKILSYHQVASFAHSIFTQDAQFGTIMTTPLNELLSYCNFEVWKVDKLLSFLCVRKFEVIDYAHRFPFVDQRYLSIIKDTVSIVSTQVIFDKKHYFSFNIERKHYLYLKENDKIFDFFTVIESAISYIYKYCKINTFFEVHPDDKPNWPQSFARSTELKHPLLENLTKIELDYLKLIATGGTAKEIAQHSHRSHRTIELTIKKISKKLNTKSKEDLVLFAKMVL